MFLGARHFQQHLPLSVLLIVAVLVSSLAFIFPDDSDFEDHG